MSKLYNNLYRMSRTEINNLAKNQFIDDDIQVWIARNSHVQARYYLAEYQFDMCDEACKVLLSGRSKIVKGLLVGSGRVADQDTIRSVYKECKDMDRWRIQNFFVENAWYRRSVRKREIETPPDVLEMIYVNSKLNDNSEPRWGYGGRYLKRALSEHKNCTPKLAIQISQDPDPGIQKFGFDALVRIEQRDK